MLFFLRFSPTRPARWPLAWLVLLLIAMPWLALAQCPSGDVTLSTQAQVNAFPPGCIRLNNSLTIRGNDITDLRPLSNLTDVNNSLIITANASLSTLAGLGNLYYVEGDLLIDSNPVLTSIAGLSGLNQVRSTFQISNNPRLTGLTGLSKLTELDGSLVIDNNPALTSIAGLSNLLSIRYVLQISNNPRLTDLTGLGSVNSVGNDLRIDNNPSLTSIAGLSALTQAGTLKISTNDLLTNLTGLSQLTDVGRVLIENNPVLTSIASLTALTGTSNSLLIIGNAKLANLAGLSNLIYVSGELRIDRNPSLTSIAGLSALTQAGALQISNSDLLTNLTGLSNLTTVGSGLIIENNPVLTSIASLSALTQIGSPVNITDNAQLSQCAIAPICQFLANSPGSVFISGNAAGCSSSAEVQDRCTPLAITTQPPRVSSVCPGTTVFAAVSTSGNARAYQWYRDGTPVTGQTSATLTLTNVQPADAGSYRVIVSNSVSSLTSTAFSLTINPLPASYRVMGGGAYCIGDAGPSVGLSGSQTGVSYQLLRGGSLTGMALPGTGTSLSFGPQPATGTYTVQATNPSSGCSQLMSSSVVVVTNPPPTVSISPSATAICAGQQGLLTASGADGYQWTTAQTTASISVSVAGTYSVTGTTTAGCSATATASLTVNPLPTPTIQGLVSSLCQEAAPVILTGTGTPTGGRFTIDGTPATTLNPASLSVGPHTVVYSFTNTSGCSNTASQPVTVKPTPAAPQIVTQSGQLYPGGQSSVSVPQYSGTLTLLISGCNGTLNWQGPNGTSGTSTSIPVSTSATGTFVYRATCQQDGCLSAPGSATVVVQSGALTMVAPLYDCQSRQLILRTTGGNGQSIEYQIASVTTGWETVSPSFTVLDKHIGRSLKLRARQRSSTGGSYVEVETSFTPTACGSARAGVSQEPIATLGVVVLGNPITGQELSVEIRGMEGQPVRLQLTDLAGRPIGERWVERASALERQTLNVSEQPAGLLLLRVSTPTQSQTVKVLKR